jgi:hypothetical protein
MTREFINGSQSIIRRQWRLSHYGGLISHLFVKFVNSSRETFTRVIDTRAGSDSIRVDELMILMNLYYYITNQRLTSARSAVIISDGLDESDALSPALTKTPSLTASTILEGWSGAVVPDRTTPPPPPLHHPGGRHEPEVCPLLCQWC